MKAPELNALIQTLGWVLLHSVWQGLMVYGLMVVVRKTLPAPSSSLKYALGIGSMALIGIASAATFIYLFQSIPTTLTLKTGLMNSPSPIAIPIPLAVNPPEAWLSASLWINNHLRDVVGLWILGILFFGGRMAIGGWYAARLRKTIIPVLGFWKERLRDLVVRMGIRENVWLAESQSVTVPVLLGYLKPVILLPVGVLSGLSVEQVESILLHELAHIQRHDYLVNLLQSFMEVVYFFNPFVWTISSQMRAEREECCDDAVVKSINPLSYAQALYKLQEARWPVTPLALAAAGRKNQLLYRIKRIMEPSENKKEEGGKMIPALVVIAVIMISGLFIRAYLPEQHPSPVVHAGTLTTAPDTTIKDLKKEKTSAHSRKVLTNTDAVEAREEVAGEIDRDADFQLAIPAIPEIEVEPADAPLGEIAALAELEALAESAQELASMDLNFESMDTLPRSYFYDGRSWSDFEKEFTEKFRERFSDFYKKNQPEIEKIMKDLEAQLGQVEAQRGLTERELMRAKREMQRLGPRQEEMMRRQAENMKRMSELDRRNSELKWKSKEWKMKDKDRWKGEGWKSHRDAFEKELTEQLVADGYLGKEEKINSIDWQDDGSITVNGKKIKESDRSKYHALHKTYFRERDHFRHEE